MKFKEIHLIKCTIIFQVDIQGWMEWGGALHYPQLARFWGNQIFFLQKAEKVCFLHYLLMSLLLLMLCSPQPFLNADVFTQFTEQLVTQGPSLTKSVKFAKMMFTALTKYGSLVSLLDFSPCMTSKHKRKINFFNWFSVCKKYNVLPGECCA